MERSCRVCEKKFVYGESVDLDSRVTCNMCDAVSCGGCMIKHLQDTHEDFFLSIGYCSKTLAPLRP